MLCGELVVIITLSCLSVSMAYNYLIGLQTSSKGLTEQHLKKKCGLNPNKTAFLLIVYSFKGLTTKPYSLARIERASY